MILRPDTPAIFEPLWTQPARYKGAHGGRGSAKSWDRGQHLVFRHAMQPGLASACLREVQATLKDSVFKLIEDTARRLEIGGLFTPVPSDSHIKCPGGGVMIFRGMNDMNADNIKSLEGFDVAWWEEAQTATQRSMDLLRPTIRKPGSELWFTWNPRLRGDPVDVMLRQDARFEPERIVVEANWRDNPMRGAELERERLLDLAGDRDRYNHIWEGAYESESDRQFIGGGMVRAAMERTPAPTLGDELVLGVDVARFGDDRSVIKARRGRDAKSMPAIKLLHANTMEVAAMVMSEIDRLNPDGVFIDEGGVGGGVVDRCRQMGYSVIGVNFGGKADRHIDGVPKCMNKRSQMWATMREWIRDGGCLEDSRALEMDLTGPLYSFDSNNAVCLERKSDMKKRGIPSPDEADALALTFAYGVVARSTEKLKQTKEVQEYDPIWGKR